MVTELDRFIWMAGWWGILIGLIYLALRTQNKFHKLLWGLVIVGYVFYTLIYDTVINGNTWL